jgi:hypothetical protein
MPVELKELNGGRILEVRATGKLVASDYVELVPTFERLKQQHGKLRVLFALHDFHGWTAGSMWEDLKFEKKHFSDIERLAIIGEAKWQEGMAKFCKPFLTAQIRFFKPAQAETAREWLAFRTNRSTGVAVFKSPDEAEAAVKGLQQGGFDSKQFSIVGQDFHSENHVVGYYNAGDRMKAWGKLGAFWGGLWGLLFGAAFFFIPGIGPVVIAGPLVSSLVAALEGAVFFGGLSALGAALFSVGIPRNSVLRYESALKSGSFLLLAHGTDEELQRIEDHLLKANQPQSFDVHPASTPAPAPVAQLDRTDEVTTWRTARHSEQNQHEPAIHGKP